MMQTVQMWMRFRVERDRYVNIAAQKKSSIVVFVQKNSANG